MIYEPRTFKGILRNSLESQQYSMEYWISSLGGNQCVIKKKKIWNRGTSVSIIKGRIKQRLKKKKKERLNFPPNLRKSVESLHVCFPWKEKTV